MRVFFWILWVLLGLGGWFATLGMKRVEPGQIAWQDGFKAEKNLTFGAGIYPTIPLAQRWTQVSQAGWWQMEPLQLRSAEGFFVQWQLAFRYHRVPCSTEAEVASLDDLPPAGLREQLAANLQGRSLADLTHPTRAALDALLVSPERGVVLDEVLLLSVRPVETMDSSWAQRTEQLLLKASQTLQEEEQKAAQADALAETEAVQKKAQDEAALSQSLADQKRSLALHLSSLRVEAERARTKLLTVAESKALEAKSAIVEAEAARKAERTKAELEIFAGEQGHYLQAILAAEQFKLGPVHLDTDNPQALRDFGSVEAWRKFFLAP